MNLYRVRFGEEEGVFEYEYITNLSSLFEINRILKHQVFDSKALAEEEEKEVLRPFNILLNSSDMEMIQSCGGTVVFRENNSWIIHYLIDLDFKKYDPTADVQLKNEWKDKVKALIESVRRDIKLNMIGV